MCTLLTVFVACDPGVAEMPDPGRDGSDFTLNGSVEKFVDFTTVGKPKYTECNGVKFPLNQYGFLTSAFSGVAYKAPSMPAVIHVTQAPNANSRTVIGYNFATDFTARFRLTDTTKAEIELISSKNAPQGFIMAELFLAGSNPHGALMLMIFPTESFPDGIPELDENVIVALNYDGAGSGSVVACRDVVGITAYNSPYDAPLDPQDNHFSIATLRVYNDAVYDPSGAVPRMARLLLSCCRNRAMLHRLR